MPFEINPKTGKTQFSFSNFLATYILTVVFSYFFYIAIFVSTKEFKDNINLNQITIVMVGLAGTIVGFYFGNSRAASKQADQITTMQKDATTIAMATANPTLAATENKVDKAVKVAELKAALEALEPESDEAIKIVAELEALEKAS